MTTGVGFAGYTYMQDVDKSKCDSSSIPIGTEGRLIDKRDNKVYWVAKLKDGLCWMTQNLDYDGGGTGTEPTLLVVHKAVSCIMIQENMFILMALPHLVVATLRLVRD